MDNTEPHDPIEAIKRLETSELKRVFAIIEIELLKRIRAEQSTGIDALKMKADSIGYSVVLQKTVPKKTVGAKPGAKKHPAKYRDPKTGETWCGYGRKPFWVENLLNANGNLEDCLIEKREKPSRSRQKKAV